MCNTKLPKGILQLQAFQVVLEKYAWIKRLMGVILTELLMRLLLLLYIHKKIVVP